MIQLSCFYCRVRDTSDKTETWDDLLEAGENPPSNPQVPWPGMARGGAANEADARGGVTRTSFLNTAGWVYSIQFIYFSIFFFFYMIPKRHFISVHSLRNEFIQVFNRNEVLVLMPISFRYHINWKRTLFWIENQTSCSLGWIAHEYLIWRENHVRENALS